MARTQDDDQKGFKNDQDAFEHMVGIYLFEKTGICDVEEVTEWMDKEITGWRDTVENQLRIRNDVQRRMFVEHYRRIPNIMSKNKFSNFLKFTKLKNTPMVELLEEISTREESTHEESEESTREEER